MNKTKILTGRKVALWLGSFFLIVFAVNGLMTYLALTSWGGLETEGAYRKGLAYNQEIKAAREQELSGWKINLDPVPILLQDSLHVTLIKPKDSMIPSLVKAYISRPATDKYDQTLILMPDTKKHFSAPLSLPFYGQWNINILVKTSDNITYSLNKRIYIKDNDTGVSPPVGK